MVLHLLATLRVTLTSHQCRLVGDIQANHIQGKLQVQHTMHMDPLHQVLVSHQAQACQPHIDKTPGLPTLCKEVTLEAPHPLETSMLPHQIHPPHHTVALHLELLVATLQRVVGTQLQVVVLQVVIQHLVVLLGDIQHLEEVLLVATHLLLVGIQLQVVLLVAILLQPALQEGTLIQLVMRPAVTLLLELLLLVASLVDQVLPEGAIQVLHQVLHQVAIPNLMQEAIHLSRVVEVQ